MKNRLIKIGLIGGSINSGISHIHFSALKMDGNFEVVSGNFSSQKKNNLLTAKKWNIDKKRIYNSLDKFIKYEKDKIDAILILSPTNNHFKDLVKASTLNIPIICEKPIASSLDEVKKIKKYLNYKNNFLAITFNYTGYPMLREAKEMIKRNKLGKLKFIQIEMPQEIFLKNKKKDTKYIKPWRLKDGYISNLSLDLLSHVYNISNFLLEKKPITVATNFASTSKINNKNIVEDILVWLNFKEKIRGSFWVSKSAIGNKNELKVKIFGEKKSLEWRQSDSENLKVFENDGSLKIIDRGSRSLISGQKRYNRYRAGHPTGFLEAFANMYEDIYNAITNLKNNKQINKRYIFDLDDALENMKFLDNISKSRSKKIWHTIK
tara:strand:+ start:113 stop:1246 length:1134 start_codon:yes stop_codon:yes gene_type:complete